MGNTVIESFSYPKKKEAMITLAKDIAKEKGMSWSEYLVDLVQSETLRYTEAEKNKQNFNKISILNSGYQTSIAEFVPMIYENAKQRQELKKWIENTDNESLKEFTKKLNDIRKMVQFRRDNEDREIWKKSKNKRMTISIKEMEEILGHRFTTFGEEEIPLVSN